MVRANPSQRYLSTRGGSYDLGFEEVVLRGLAPDGGLFMPEEIPELPKDWRSKWRDHSFAELAFEILSLYISPDEIPPSDLQDIIARSYSTFRAPEVTPLVTLDEEKKLYLLELFNGPTYAFKDVALQFLGNLFEYFLVRRNQQKPTQERHRLTVVGATSGDTGSAAIYGLRGKKDVSLFILHPMGKVSPIQEAQMTTVLDPNVHNLAVEGSFDDCQDIVKSLFADPEINKTQNLAAVNSINWARILAQITYYFHAYFSLARSPNFETRSPKIRFVVPTGNFGDVLAGWFAEEMGLPVDRFVVATNANDILDRFWKSGRYEKKPVRGSEAQGGFSKDGAEAHSDGVKETLSPAMDILVSSNFERLLWHLAYKLSVDVSTKPAKRRRAGEQVNTWLNDLKGEGGFYVGPEILEAAKKDFESERVSDEETTQTIKATYGHSLPASQLETPPSTRGSRIDSAYVLDPHTAVGITAAQRSMERAPPPDTYHIALATAHPAKFSHAVDLALKTEPGYSFSAVLPEDFIGLEDRERRVISVKSDPDTNDRERGLINAVRKIIYDEVERR